MSELESHAEIAARAARLLHEAGAVGRFPTPVDDILEAAKLIEPKESLLSEGMIKRAPAHLQEKLARFIGRVRGLVDRRALEVHLSPEIAVEGRRRFVRLHEVIHHLLPWQTDSGYVDTEKHLSASADELFELEASDGAAELLFQGQGFARDAADLEVGLPAVVAGHNRYGSSLRSALRRYPTTHRAAVVSVVLEVSPLGLSPLRFRRHEMSMSPSFASRFGPPTWPGTISAERYPFLAVAAAAAASKHLVVSDECTLLDLAGEVVRVRVDALHTGYDLLVLVWIPIKERTRRQVRLVA